MGRSEADEDLEGSEDRRMKDDEFFDPSFDLDAEGGTGGSPWR